MDRLKDRNYNQEMGERFQLFRSILELSQQQMAAALAAAAADIERIEKGDIDNDLLYHFMHGLNRHFGLSINWFISGKGSPFVPAMKL